jgi:hypothetical protein
MDELDEHDPQPTRRRVRSFTIEAGMAALLLAIVGLWWAGVPQSEFDHPFLAVLIHVCAVFQAAKVGWMIFWMRRLPRHRPNSLT